MPRSSASCFTSISFTAMPTLAKFMAMPPPMVPAPMMPTVVTGMTGVSSATSGTFHTWRSAKKV